MNTSLSDQQMHKYTGAPVILYPQLKNIHGIEELFISANSNKVVLCFLTKPNYGHWITLFKNSEGINFFDSYGLAPDDQLDFKLDPIFRIQSHEDYPYLNKLLLTSHKPIIYNEYQYQSHAKGVATCGRWVILRLFYQSLLNEQFRNLIILLTKKLGVSSDELVVLLTNFIN